MSQRRLIESNFRRSSKFFGTAIGFIVFLNVGMRVEGDGKGTEAEASNRKGNGIWVDPGAAKVFDVVDGQGSLVDGRGEDGDGVKLVANVVKAGGGIE